MIGLGIGLRFQRALAAGAPSGGAIDIVVGTRSTLMCNPDSVQFWVDLGSSTFDTPAGDAFAGEYDPRMHEIYYLWDFGDAGDALWTAPVNTLDVWKNRNIGIGPNVSHMYRAPGTYVVTVTAFEPSSGKIATTTESVVVADADDVFPLLNTVCVNPTGDSDFTWNTFGAAEKNADNPMTAGAWMTDVLTDQLPKRWLFKRGGAYHDMAIALNGPGYNRNVDWMFGAYGDPAQPKPVINIASAAGKGMTTTGNFGLQPRSDTPDLRWENLHFQGDFDPTVDLAVFASHPTRSNGAIGISTRVDGKISSCDFAGMANYSATCSSSETFFNRWAVDDCTFTDFGGQYACMLIGSSVNNSTVDLTGNSFVQPPLAIDDRAAQRSPVRIQGQQFGYYAGNDWFHTDRQYACIKALETPDEEGYLVNIHGNAFESGSNFIVIAGNVTQSALTHSPVSNVVIDSNVGLGTFNTYEFVRARGTGITFRNNLMNQPATAAFEPGLIGLISCEAQGTVPAISAAGPIKVYNNTLRTMRTGDNNGNPQTVFGSDFDPVTHTFTDVTEFNNVIYAPNEAVPQIGSEPLSSNVLFAPRTLADVPQETPLVPDYTRATPGDTMQQLLPLAGSAALEAATSGDVAYRDGYGVIRPSPSADGAWEFVDGFNPPDAFVGANWSVATGTADTEIDVTLASLPASDETITDVEYDANASGTWVSLGATTGIITISMAVASTSYDIRLRAVSSNGSGLPGNTETAVSAGPTYTVIEDFSGAPDYTASVTTDDGMNGGIHEFTVVSNASARSDWLVTLTTGKSYIFVGTPRAPSSTSIKFRLGDNWGPGGVLYFDEVLANDTPFTFEHTHTDPTGTYHVGMWSYGPGTYMGLDAWEVRELG